MQAYLRESVLNRIRDEVRRIGRHPAPTELPDDLPAEQMSSLEKVIAWFDLSAELESGRAEFA